METRLVKLSQLCINAVNPRTITEQKFEKLVNSLLTFPAMLEIRPIVVDKMMTILGGNMRCRALQEIAMWDEAKLRSRISELPDFVKRSLDEQDEIMTHWAGWIKDQKVLVADGSSLTDAEVREFIIKDNVSFGEWDYEALAANWPAEDLSRWGVETWAGGKMESATEAKQKEASESNKSTVVFTFTIEQWRDVNAYLLKLASTKEEALITLMDRGCGLDNE